MSFTLLGPREGKVFCQHPEKDTIWLLDSHSFQFLIWILRPNPFHWFTDFLTLHAVLLGRLHYLDSFNFYCMLIFFKYLCLQLRTLFWAPDLFILLPHARVQTHFKWYLNVFFLLQVRTLLMTPSLLSSLEAWGSFWETSYYLLNPIRYPVRRTYILKIPQIIHQTLFSVSPLLYTLSPLNSNLLSIVFQSWHTKT